MKSGPTGFDGAVIGGGPAGMFAALAAAEAGARVVLVERNDHLGRKLRITGKGRCNVTNQCSVREVLENIPRNGRFLYSAMNRCPPQRVMDFFEENGCPLKTERGNRVFPTSDKAQSVVDCLTRRLRRAGVTVVQDRVRELRTREGAISAVVGEKGEFPVRWAILATGGMSYPATGSTGDGYALAAALGHDLVPPEGSLVPLETEEPPEMEGLSLRNVGVRLLDREGKLLYRDFGELLFTAFGLSGPTALSASAHVHGPGCRLVIDLKPALTEEKLDSRLLRDLEQYRNRTMEHALGDLLPRSLIRPALKRAAIDPAMPANALRRDQRRGLTALLKGYEFPLRGKRPIQEAIVTAGGISVAQVDPKTMGSRLVPGLYFAGEILDCDGYTGGFNLQIAWATGFAAGTAAGTQKTDIDKRSVM